MKLSALFQMLIFLLFALPNAEGASNASPSRTGDDLFAKANTEFAAGNFKSAIADYNAVVGSGEWSANLFYDLGNAYFRDGDFGRAILNYDRAVRLDRHHPEADANLRIARDQTHSLELTPPALERYLNFGTANFFAVVAAIFFWLTIILLILRPGRVLWAIAGMFLAAICGFVAYRLENGTHGQDLAIVIAENAEARVATVDSAKSVLALPAGSEVLILQERGDWNYAALPNDQRGWIAASAVEKVRL
jgi:tetratricopeptide (TPR) repeat protein